MAAVLLASCTDNGPSDNTPVYRYRVINTYKHDRNAFTQGLVFDNGFLYEGTGLYGKSTLRKVKLQSGIITQTRALPKEYFGEGITICEDRIIQLTLKSRTGFVYDKDTFKLLKKFNYPNQGWGITYDGSRLIMSDGSSALYFLNPRTFNQTGHIQVYDAGGPVGRLNELEYVKGRIYANIWQTDRIAVIDPQTGRVTAWIDLAGLLNKNNFGRLGVLNGIAYDPNQNRLFVTGKLWPKLFEIQLVTPKSRPPQTRKKQ